MTFLIYKFFHPPVKGKERSPSRSNITDVRVSFGGVFAPKKKGSLASKQHQPYLSFAILNRNQKSFVLTRILLFVIVGVDVMTGP